VQFHSPDKRAVNRLIALPAKAPPPRNAPPPPSPSRSVATSHGSRPTAPPGGRMAMAHEARAASGASGINRRSRAGSRRPPAVARDPQRAAATGLRAAGAFQGRRSPPGRPHGDAARSPARVRGFRDKPLQRRRAETAPRGRPRSSARSGYGRACAGRADMSGAPPVRA
jgi:hypothetical protein